MESPHVCHSADCGEFQCEYLNTTSQDFKFQASRCHYLNLAVVPSMKILSFIQLIGYREKVDAINYNMNKCHWHSPMRKQFRRALVMWKATCQPFPSTTWMLQNYIYEQDIFVSKIYLWTKYIYEQNISMSKIYLWAKYIYEQNISLGNIYEQNISMIKIYLWAIYIYNINMNHDF